jgi:hypothetical protein
MKVEIQLPQIPQASFGHPGLGKPEWLELDVEHPYEL